MLNPPAMPLTLLADMAGAQTTVSHALAVLAERNRTGEGVFSYVPIAGALEFFTLPLRYGLTVPGGRLAGTLPFYNIYPTRDGWLAVAALEPQFWAKLQALLALKRRHVRRAEGRLRPAIGRRVGAVRRGASPAPGGRADVPAALEQIVWSRGVLWRCARGYNLAWRASPDALAPGGQPRDASSQFHCSPRCRPSCCSRAHYEESEPCTA